jgi:exodeoxyribonuclease VII small subunit
MAEKNADISTPATFDQLLAETEGLAERMEDGGLTLEQALAAYEKGVENLRRCAGILREAEARVKVLMEKSDGFRLDDFEPGHGETSGGADPEEDAGDGE